jgi:hypothetical protein
MRGLVRRIRLRRPLTFLNGMAGTKPGHDTDGVEEI